VTASSANKNIARAAGTVMFAIVLGQVAGLARSIIVAHIFGASPELSAFYYGNRVSETLFLLVAGGALGSAFIPTFTGFLAKGDISSAWSLAASLARLVTLTLSLLAAIAAFFAPQVVRYALAPGFASDPHLFPLIVNLLRIQLISAVLFGLGGLIVGILNAHQVFLIPALTPAMYQLGIIFGAVFLSPTMGVYGLAWGVVIGAGFYLILQIPSLIKVIPSLASRHLPRIQGIWGRLRGGFGLRDANTRHVLLLMGPRLLGVAVVQINFWVNGYLASFMGEESMAGLSYGFSLMLMAQAAIAQSVAIAAMPTFSAQHALGQRDEMRNSLAASLRGVILLALPASLGLILLREPLVAALYQRGEFTARSTELVAWSLLWYAAGLVGHSIMEVLTRAFYAQHDTKTPVLIGTIAMGLNIVFSITFSKFFEQIGWFPLGGLALANSLATALEATVLFIVMRKRLNGIEGKWLVDGTGKASAAALGMGITLGLWIRVSWNLNHWLIALGGVAAGGIVYGIILLILRVSEIQSLVRLVMRKSR
jgi:putative peptidoglycan lipid II flippase